MAMLESLGKIVANKVVTAILAIAVIGAGIYFWRNPDDLAAVWAAVKYALAWLGFVVVLPWATFFVPRWVMSKDSNAASGLMLAGYLLADAALALWLLGGFRGHNTLTWSVVVLGLLAAGVYNYAACEYQALRFEDSV